MGLGWSVIQLVTCTEKHVIRYTVKPVNKGHRRERQHMVFVDKCSLFGGNILLFKQGRVTEVWPLITGRPLFGGGLKYRSDCTK